MGTIQFSLHFRTTENLYDICEIKSGFAGEEVKSAFP